MGAGMSIGGAYWSTDQHLGVLFDLQEWLKHMYVHGQSVMHT